MSDFEAAGEFPFDEIEMRIYDTLDQDFRNLEVSLQTDIDEFDAEVQDFKRLDLTPVASLTEHNPSYTMRLRARMLSNIGIPVDGVALPDLDVAWKHEDEGNIRLMSLQRKEKPDILVRIHYTRDNREAERLELLGTREGAKIRRKMTYTQEDRNLDLQLCASFGVTTDQAAELDFTREEKKAMLAELNAEQKAKPKSPIGKVPRSLRKQAVRDLLGKQVGKNGDGKESYAEFIENRLKSGHVDSITKYDFLLAERKKRYELIARHIRLRLAPKFFAAVTVQSGKIIAFGTAGYEAGELGIVNKPPVYAAAAGIALGFASGWASMNELYKKLEFYDVLDTVCRSEKQLHEQLAEDKRMAERLQAAVRSVPVRPRVPKA